MDTWEAHIFGGVAVLAVYGVGLLMAAIGVVVGKGGRLQFSFACGSFALAWVLEAVSLELLTRRTEALIGHELQWLV